MDARAADAGQPAPAGRGTAHAVAAACLVALTIACGTRDPILSDCVPPPCPAGVPPPHGAVPCYSARELDEIDHDLPIWFQDDPSAGAFACTAAAGSRDLTRLQAQVYQALMYMKEVRFDQPLPWTTEPLYEWFTATARGLSVSSRIPNSFDQGRVIHVRATSEWVRQPDSTFPLFVGLLVHEARHAEVGDHTCSAKDNTIAEMAAYGAQYSLMIWMGEHDPRATPPEKAYTLNQAAALRCTVFCRGCR